MILFTRAREELGSVDVCAAVAGVWPRDDEPVWRLSLARWEEVLRANLTATFLTARGFLREVQRNGRGNLVLVGSTAGRFGEAGHADYAAAKAAIQVGLLLSLKNEIVRIAPGGRVNAVAPGWTYSPMTRGALEDEFVDRLTRTMALRKVALADDVARAVVVLASDELSGHVTGEVVTVAGGMEGRTDPPVDARKRRLATPLTPPCRRMIAVSPRKELVRSIGIRAARLECLDWLR